MKMLDIKFLIISKIHLKYKATVFSSNKLSYLFILIGVKLSEFDNRRFKSLL